MISPSNNRPRRPFIRRSGLNRGSRAHAKQSTAQNLRCAPAASIHCLKSVSFVGGSVKSPTFGPYALYSVVPGSSLLVSVVFTTA